MAVNICIFYWVVQRLVIHFVPLQCVARSLRLAMESRKQSINGHYYSPLNVMIHVVVLFHIDAVILAI